MGTDGAEGVFSTLRIMNFGEYTFLFQIFTENIS
jgi:hypothetical protein